MGCVIFSRLSSGSRLNKDGVYETVYVVHLRTD